MKTTKKILMGLGIAFLGNFAAEAQGLQNIIVEKYYKTDAADATNAFNNSSASPLNAGSTVYRVYVDMAAGYKLNAVYGNATHDWKITTTTNFYNDPNNGSAVGPQGTSLVNTKKNTVLIDSWLTMGGVCVGKVGVQKTEDVDGSIGNSQGVLANNPGGVYGVAINSVVVGAQDGLAPGSPVGPTALGLNNADAIFDQTPGGSFLVNGGSVAALGGVVGTTTTNAVLIGQFTTDGTFGFELNVQVQNTVTGTAENWVANNPQAGEFTLAALTLAPPTVGITSPLNGANVITGNVVAITATAAAVAGITSVQFFVDGVSVGTDLTSPYSANYTAVTGSHTLTALATDANTTTATSSAVVITAAANQAPNITVSAPASALVGNVVTFTANAVDVDGTVASVTFSVDNIAIGTTTVGGPSYTFTWVATPFGVHNVKASAVDNLGLASTSSPVNFNVVPNILPSVSINTPLNNASVIAPQVVTITATATDADGTIALVEAFVNNVSIGTYTTSGPLYIWTYATSTLTSVDVIKVVATDNAAGSSTATPVSINIVNPNALPYELGAVKQKCTQGSFCLPIAAALTYSVDNVIGYDIVLNYDATKVTPTGIVNVNAALINPSYVTTINTYTNGVMNISAYFNGAAPANAEWNGTGELFCVGFTKTAMASVDTAVYTISSLQESYFSGVTLKPASNGKYTTYKDTMFNASLEFWADNSPLAYNSANPNANLITNIYGSSPACVVGTVAVQPDLNGDFVYNILNGSSISISRNILPATNVQPAINTADEIIVRQILLNTATGTLTPSIYQFIAADVNLDGVVSAGDLSQLKQRSGGLLTEFKQAWNYNAAGTNTLGVDSKDWIFVDSVRIDTDPAYSISATYPSNDNVGYSKAKVPVTPFCLPVTVTGLLSCPSITNEIYRGIMVADVNGNFSVLNGTLQLRPNGDKVIIDLTKGIFNGTSVDVPVSFVSSSPVLGVDMAIQFDESNLTFNGMVNYSSTSDLFAYFNPNDKTLKFNTTNVDLSTYSADRPVASIRFETKNGMINAEELTNTVGYLNGEPVAVEVLNRTVGINPTSADNSVSVFPNPTNGILNITSVSDATVEMFDVTGKQVLLTTSVNASKTQQVNVSGFVNGVYILKVYNNDFITIKKVILSK